MSQLDAFAALLASDPTVAPELKDAVKRAPTVEHVYPPVPFRTHDWCAYFDPEAGPYGWGCTRETALDDLEQIMGESVPSSAAGPLSASAQVAHQQLLDDDSDFWCAYDEDGTFGGADE